MRGCNQKITVYNRYINGEGTEENEAYQRFILPMKCKWIHKTDRETAGHTALIADKFTVIIPFTENYMTSNLWDKLSESERGNYFTLKPGDIVFLGEKTVDVDHTQNKDIKDIKEMFYPDWFAIKSFSDNTKDLQGRHWRADGE